MRFYGFDWTYLVFILPCVLLSLFCQIKVSSAFSKYSQVPNSRRMTGAQAAEYVLRQNGVYVRRGLCTDLRRGCRRRRP